jgi:hypothetical protein
MVDLADQLAVRAINFHVFANSVNEISPWKASSKENRAATMEFPAD